MKKTALLGMLCLSLATSVFTVSCKKSDNTKKGPVSYRLSAYTEVTSTNGVKAITDNYKFAYNPDGKVATIAFSTNNPDPGISGNTRTFSYDGNRVYIAIAFVKDQPSQTDTLILNAGGDIQTIIDTG